MRPFLLLTDHKSLKNLDEIEMTPWIANILDTISIFDLTTRHKPGSENVLADYLSRELPKAYINTITVDAAKIVADAHAIGHFGAPTLMLLLKNQSALFPSPSSEPRPPCSLVCQSLPHCVKARLSKASYHKQIYDQPEIDLAFRSIP